MAGALPWGRLFEQFFSADPDEAAGATTTFARTIRFWLARLGVRDEDLCSDDLVRRSARWRTCPPSAGT